MWVPSKSNPLAKYAISLLLAVIIKPDRIKTREQVLTVRSRLDKIGRAIPLSKGIKRTQFKVDHIACEWLTPPNPSPGVLLYIHGGGYNIGSTDSHRSLVAWLAKKMNRTALMFNYRKAPEHPYPAPQEDAMAIYQWVLAQGFDPKGIVVAGDSAGGGLTLELLKQIRNTGLPQPAAACCLSPWADQALTGPSMNTNHSKDLVLSRNLLSLYSTFHFDNNPEAHNICSPLFDDFTSLPPTLIQVGSNEVLLDDSIRVAKKMAADGVSVDLEIWEDMQHVWHYSGHILKDGKLAINRICDFFNQHLSQHQNEAL